MLEALYRTVREFAHQHPILFNTLLTVIITPILGALGGLCLKKARLELLYDNLSLPLWLRRSALYFARGVMKRYQPALNMETIGTDGEASARETLLYNHKQATRFVGRAKELNHLRQFKNDACPNNKNLKLWSIAGKGGQGKSRLAFMFCQETPAPHHKRRWFMPQAKTEWQGWQRGFITEKSAFFEHVATWRPTHPTFIVMDETAVTETLQKHLATMANASKHYCYPVRVLFIWRDETQLHFKKRVDDDTLQGYLYHHGESLRLEPLEAEAQRLVFNDRAGLPENDTQAFADAMRKVSASTQELERGLFIQYVADYYRYLQQQGTVEAFTLCEVLKYALKKDRDAWEIQAQTLQVDLTNVEKVLHDATLQGGLPETNPPRLTTPENRLYTAMVGGTNIKGMGVYPPLLPDALGSYYLLDVLTTAGQEGCTGRSAGALTAYYQQAWQEAPQAMYDRFIKVVHDMAPVMPEALTEWVMDVVGDSFSLVDLKAACLYHLVLEYSRIVLVYVSAQQPQPCIPYVEAFESLQKRHPHISFFMAVLAWTYQNMTGVYAELSQAEACLVYVEKLEGLLNSENTEVPKLEPSTRNKVVEALAGAYYNMTVVYSKLSQVEDCVAYVEKIEKLLNSENIEVPKLESSTCNKVAEKLAGAYHNMAFVYRKLSQVEDCVAYVEKIEKLLNSENTEVSKLESSTCNEVVKQLAEAYCGMTFVYRKLLQAEACLGYVEKLEELLNSENTEVSKLEPSTRSKVVEALARAYQNMTSVYAELSQAEASLAYVEKIEGLLNPENTEVPVLEPSTRNEVVKHLAGAYQNMVALQAQNHSYQRYVNQVYQLAKENPHVEGVQAVKKTLQDAGCCPSAPESEAEAELDAITARLNDAWRDR
jgi:tetratricopeptide (TPR) repeat protein